MSAKFGKLERIDREFEHCGIKHETTDKGILMHQNHYAAQLRPIDEGLLSGHSEVLRSKPSVKH